MKRSRREGGGRGKKNEEIPRMMAEGRRERKYQRGWKREEE